MTTRRRPLDELVASQSDVSDLAHDAGCSAEYLARTVLRAIADVGGVVHDLNVDSSNCGARTKSLSCVGPVGHAGSHIAYRGAEVLLWKTSNSYSFECSRGQINAY
ncbi:hypothetical protein [Rathayibacter sp. VKM Ac-2630]|uniref:hypothetical protein n=1 Tax=Rathayibacter sp. VKM Ac-2630 TaxID=1938617 RepID=UPI0011158B64|nr:hypothetical protein [Rathayibacter sp. VKM Ac-2630]